MTAESRILRLRLERPRPDPAGRARWEASPRFLGVVVNGGSMPTAPDRYVLVRPNLIDGAETEGASATAVATGATIAAIRLAPRRPNAGDLVVVHDVGGRWAADRAGAADTVTCNDCEVPRTNLTLTSINTIQGTRQSIMTFDGDSSWATSCINQIIFRLSCGSGSAVFTADQFAAGSCPTGSRTTCSSQGASPGLTPAAASCSPFLRTYVPTACPSISSLGYTSFTITL